MPSAARTQVKRVVTASATTTCTVPIQGRTTSSSGVSRARVPCSQGTTAPLSHSSRKKPPITIRTRRSSTASKRVPHEASSGQRRPATPSTRKPRKTSTTKSEKAARKTGEATAASALGVSRTSTIVQNHFTCAAAPADVPRFVRNPGRIVAPPRRWVVPLTGKDARVFQKGCGNRAKLPLRQVMTLGASRPVRSRIPAMVSAAATSGASTSCVSPDCLAGSGS